MNAQPQHGSEVGALRQQFAEKHQIVLRSFFTPEECEDIVEWADFRDGRLRNCFGDPDSHAILSRVNAGWPRSSVGATGTSRPPVHYSSDVSPNTHNVHIDFPQGLFATVPRTTYRFGLFCGARPEAEGQLLNLWTGFRPDASKKFDGKDVSMLEKHEVKGTDGRRCPRVQLVAAAFVRIHRPPLRAYAFKVHYYSDRPSVTTYLRHHLREALRSSQHRNPCWDRHGAVCRRELWAQGVARL